MPHIDIMYKKHFKMRELFNSAQKCNRCYHNNDLKVPYFESRNGSKNIKIMFINERPGRVGPGESDLVSQFNNDPSARTFKYLLSLLKNINNKDIFITNSCLCYLPNIPVNEQHPNVEELKNCHYWLEKQIRIANPKLIITIGRKALESLRRLEKFKKSKRLKNFNLKQNIGSIIDDTNPKIYPLYHTSRMGQIHRSLKKQEKDWSKINNFI